MQKGDGIGEKFHVNCDVMLAVYPESWEAGLRSFTLSTGPCEFHSKYLLWRTDCTPSSGQCPGALVRTT